MHIFRVELDTQGRSSSVLVRRIDVVWTEIWPISTMLTLHSIWV